MSQVSDQEVEAIKEWLAKEPHLPKNFFDLHIKKFIFSCHNSLERTKRCIEDFCTRRATMSEIYTKRDPMMNRIQRAFEITSVTTYMDGNNEVLFYGLKDVTNFDFYDCLKSFTLQADIWIQLPADRLPENHIIVYDMALHTMRLMAKVNIFYLQKFLIFLLETMPVRLKEVHVINCPPFYETMFNLVKPALPEYLCKMMHFHPDHTGLYEFINKKILPKELGGEGESMVEQHAYWIKEISKNRKTFTDDTFWKADLTFKKRNDVSVTSMQGSFKTLEID